MKRLSFRVDAIVQGRKIPSDKLDLLLKLWTFHLKVDSFSNDGLTLKIAQVKRMKKRSKLDELPAGDPWRQKADKLI